MKVSVKFANLDKALRGIENQLQEDFADMVETLWYELVGHTPRDTGRAQNSWQVLGRYERMKQTPPGQYGTPVFPGMPPSERLGKVRVASDVDYMVFLNDGHSKQAPSLFVERAINKVQALYR